MRRFFISLAAAFSLLAGGGALLVPSYAMADDCVKLSVPIDGQSCVAKNQPGGPIMVYVRALIKFLAGAVGLVVVLMIVVSGIQYITSAGDPGQIKNAKTRLINAITGLVLFLLTYAIINFIVPGGVLG